MKLLIAFLVASMATLAHAAGGIPVHLDPQSDSPQIGEIETLSLAVPAQWPSNVAAIEGWQPVYYHGVFEVYVDNNDIGKDLNAKPGSLYYLSPQKNAISLSIATEKDKVDILSVDSWFCKMQLETIVLGYIPNSTISASSIVTSLPDTHVSTTAKTTATAITELVGRLEKTGLVGRNRTGLNYKLTGEDGKTLAFIDTTGIPERIQVDQFLSLKIRISGFLTQSESGSDVILKAESIKNAN